MGRIVVTEYISVDGVVEAPSGTESFERVGWTDAFSRGPEGDQFKLDETRASDALLLGRVTYDGFAPVWPQYEGELADKFNSMPKYVVSQTLSNPEWNNTTVLTGDVVEEVTRLKEQYEGDIVVHGSPQLARGPMDADLSAGGVGFRHAAFNISAMATWQDASLDDAFIRWAREGPIAASVSAAA
jgi:dihydrofolate reductase